MNTGQQSVKICVDESNKAKLSLEDISQQINSITNMNLQIATSAEEQSSVGTTMNESLQEISSLANGNANSADTVLSKNQDVNRSLSTLNELLKSFKLH